MDTDLQYGKRRVSVSEPIATFVSPQDLNGPVLGFTKRAAQSVGESVRGLLVSFSQRYPKAQDVTIEADQDLVTIVGWVENTEAVLLQALQTMTEQTRTTRWVTRMLKELIAELED